MGKRELLIIAAFLVVGAAVYQLTATPPRDGQGFSLSRFWQRSKSTVRGNAPLATETLTGTLPLDAAIKQVRVSGVNGVLQIAGEDRRDIGYELTVSAGGADEAAAREAIKRATLTTDDLGEAVELRVAYPREGRVQSRTLVLRVPARLDVRIDHNGVAMVQGLRRLEVESTGGTYTLSGITELVTGYHRQGEITITDVAAIDLTLAGSRARIKDVSGRVALNARQGRAEVTDVKGAVEIEGASQDLVLARIAGTIRVTGRDGKITIDDPGADTRVEMRACDVTVTLRRAVPVQLFTSERPLRLLLAGPPAVAIDAIATEGGHITAEDFGLSPEASDHEERLQHAFGASTPRVTLRNLRASVVIGKPK
jgi:hypothetical protein